MPMIGYIEEYIDDDGLLDANQLLELLKTSYNELRQGGEAGSSMDEGVEGGPWDT